MELLVSTMIDEDKFKEQLNGVIQYYDMMGLDAPKISFELINDCGEAFNWVEGNQLDYIKKSMTSKIELQNEVKGRIICLPATIEISGRVDVENLVMLEAKTMERFNKNISGRVKNFYMLNKIFNYSHCVLTIENLYIIRETDVAFLNRGITYLIVSSNNVIYNKPIVHDSTYYYIDLYHRQWTYNFTSEGKVNIVGLNQEQINMAKKHLSKGLLIQQAYNETLKNLRQFDGKKKFKLQKNIDIPVDVVRMHD